MQVIYLSYLPETNFHRIHIGDVYKDPKHAMMKFGRDDQGGASYIRFHQDQLTRKRRDVHQEWYHLQPRKLANNLRETKLTCHL